MTEQTCNLWQDPDREGIVVLGAKENIIESELSGQWVASNYVMEVRE